jgi:hypothetical protein
MTANEMLVAGGVAAILGALVGGGLKAFGVELPILASLRRQAVLGLTGLALIAAGLLVRPAAEAAPEAAAPAPAVEAREAAAPAGPVRPSVPNIVGMEMAAARQFLTQNGWSPLMSGVSPMANDGLGMRAKEVFETGWLETAMCSGASMAPCVLRYRNPDGYGLEVVTVGEELARARVQTVTVLDCPKEPETEGCRA